jgi:hypothetical protein
MSEFFGDVLQWITAMALGVLMGTTVKGIHADQEIREIKISANKRIESCMAVLR